MPEEQPVIPTSQICVPAVHQRRWPARPPIGPPGLRTGPARASVGRVWLGRQVCQVCLLWLVGSGWLGLPHAGAQERIVVGFVDRPHTTAHVVRVGDLIHVLAGNSAEVERLLEMPLGPAPRADTGQTWHASDVLQHLELRGLSPERLRWSGATQTQLQRIVSPDASLAESIQPAFVQTRTIELAQNLVAQAIKEYLDLKTGEQTQWDIRVSIPPRLANDLRIRRNIVGIGGGQAPWLGKQEFVLQVTSGSATVSVPLTAEIALPPLVLVAKRPLRRDEILSADDLDLAPLVARSGEEPGKYFLDSEQLVGQQLKRSVSTGLPIARDYVGSPTVITRNEMVEVEAVSGGVSVRTMARSLASGAVGELIDIETVPGKQRMLATVVGPLKVRVAAVSARGGLSR